MKITEISFRALKTGSGYNNSAVEAKAVIEGDEDPRQALAELRFWVEKQLDDTLKLDDEYATLADVQGRIVVATAEAERFEKHARAARQFIADCRELADLPRAWQRRHRSLSGEPALMAEHTKIQWADSTANLWIGCTKLSMACDNCYAEADFDLRKGRVEWGPHGDRSYCKAGWTLLDMLQRRATRNGGFDPELGRKRRIFINSLSDFFDNHRSIVWRDAAWQKFRECPDLIIMLVTKRPQNIEKMLPEFWDEIADRVWLLATVENQEEADRRIPALLWSTAGRASAAIYGLSVEPLLGPVDLQSIKARRWPDEPEDEFNIDWRFDALEVGDYYWFDGEHGQPGDSGDGPYRENRIGWVIGGGESGPKARPSHPEWFRALRDQCAKASLHGDDAPVPFLFKQWGEWALGEGTGDKENALVTYVPYDGSWGAADRVDARGFAMHRAGKKSAGRLLDGVQHDGVPA